MFVGALEKKVLHLSGWDKMGGAEVQALEMSREFGFDLLVKKKITDSSNVIEFPKFLSDRVEDFINRFNWKIGFKKKVKDLFFINEEFNFTYEKLNRIEAFKRAEIIHLHNIHGGYFDLEALVKICFNKKVIWTLHDMWALTGGEAYVFEDVGYQLGDAKSPYIENYPLNGPILDRRQVFLEKKRNIYRVLSDKITFVPVSKWLESAFKQSYVYNDKLAVKQIYNGINTNIFRNFNQRDWQKHRILFFNSNSPFKGSDDFRKVLQNIDLDLFQLYTIGIPTELPNEVFLSNSIMERKELVNIFNQVDILVFPSRAEALGLVPMEAMACGVFVVASKVGGITEIMPSENPCFFLGTEELHEKLTLLLNEPIEKIREKGLVFSKHIGENFPLDLTLGKYENLYREIISS